MNAPPNLLNAECVRRVSVGLGFIGCARRLGRVSDEADAMPRSQILARTLATVHSHMPRPPQPPHTAHRETGHFLSRLSPSLWRRRFSRQAVHPRKKVWRIAYTSAQQQQQQQPAQPQQSSAAAATTPLMQPPPYDQAIAGPSKPPRKVRGCTCLASCVMVDLLCRGASIDPPRPNKQKSTDHPNPNSPLPCRATAAASRPRGPCRWWPG